MPRYSDEQLIQILQKSARRLNRRLNLFGTSDEISVDASGVVSPSDGSLEDLVLLQAECLLASRDFTSDLSNGLIGVAVSDGEQAIDTRSKAGARQAFFDSKHGPCAELEKEIRLEELKRSSDNAKLIW